MARRAAGRRSIGVGRAERLGRQDEQRAVVGPEACGVEDSVSVPLKYGAEPVRVTSSLSPVPGLVTVTCMPDTPLASTTDRTACPLAHWAYADLVEGDLAHLGSRRARRDLLRREELVVDQVVVVERDVAPGERRRGAAEDVKSACS